MAAGIDEGGSMERGDQRHDDAARLSRRSLLTKGAAAAGVAAAVGANAPFSLANARTIRLGRAKTTITLWTWAWPEKPESRMPRNRILLPGNLMRAKA